MAGGLAVVAPRVGDIAQMVAEPNQAYLCEPGDEAALAEALKGLAAETEQRNSIGEANRRKALAQFDEARMIAAYRQVYAGALGRAAFP
jgi:L-malate glycosyltransferase